MCPSVCVFVRCHKPTLSNQKMLLTKVVTYASVIKNIPKKSKKIQNFLFFSIFRPFLTFFQFFFLNRARVPSRRCPWVAPGRTAPPEELGGTREAGTF